MQVTARASHLGWCSQEFYTDLRVLLTCYDIKNQQQAEELVAFARCQNKEGLGMGPTPSSRDSVVQETRL
jgi:hypothetical protein